MRILGARVRDEGAETAIAGCPVRVGAVSRLPGVARVAADLAHHGGRAQTLRRANTETVDGVGAHGG